MQINNRVMEEDLNRIVSEYTDIFEQLKGKSILVTGATGLLGSQVVKALVRANDTNKYDIRVMAFARSEEKAKKVFGEALDGQIKLVLGDINSPIQIDDDIDYIVHGASATSSKYFVTNPVETILTAIEGSRNILELARNKSVSGMVYLSSLEVYGVPQTKNGYVRENDYGYIDILNTRSSYSEGKKMVECLCASYAAEYGVPVRIARLSQTFGPGVEYNDGRVFAEFARCALEKRDIVLHTAGKTLRTYLYTADAVGAILTLLVKGENGKAYNVTNPDTDVTIYEMAELVCRIMPESNIKVIIDEPKDIGSFGYNPEMVIRLVPDALMELGWKPMVDLENMYRRLIAEFGE